MPSSALRNLQAKNTARRASVQEELAAKRTPELEHTSIILIQANARASIARQRHRDARDGIDLGVPGKEGSVEVRMAQRTIGPHVSVSLLPLHPPPVTRHL